MNWSQLNEDVVFGKAEGRIIWQPRIGCWYTDKIFKDGVLPGRYKGKDMLGVYRELGCCSARLYEFNECIQPVFDETIRFSKTVEGSNHFTVIQTPVGSVTEIRQTTSSCWAKLVKKYFCENEDDLRVYAYIERHTDWRFDRECYDSIKRSCGDLGAPCVFIQRVNLQRLYINLMGVENTVYALMDCPEVVEDYFAALHESHVRLLDVVCACPIKIINFGDNHHAGTVSPDLFRHYVLPEYQWRNAVLHAAGKFTHAHYDGDNQGLMEMYQETGLNGIEAITPKPQGDVELEEVRRYLGKEQYLFDGIPAVYFDTTFSEETLIECTHKIIELFAPRLVLGISDEISSTGDIERIRIVAKIVEEYNQNIEKKLRAQGKPFKTY